MTTGEMKAFVMDLYKSGALNASWVHSHLVNAPSRVTVYRWLSGQSPTSNDRWVEMYSIATANRPDVPRTETAFDLAIEVLTNGATDEAKQLAAQVIKENRRTYGDQ